MSDFSGRLIFRLSAERPRFYRFDRGRRRCGQGELSWRVYAPPHMTADAVQACAVSILGPLATFERTQPKGAFSFQSEAPSTGNSRDFGADDQPERPLPFVWQAWKAWRVEPPPDG